MRPCAERVQRRGEQDELTGLEPCQRLRHDRCRALGLALPERRLRGGRREAGVLRRLYLPVTSRCLDAARIAAPRGKRGRRLVQQRGGLARGGRAQRPVGQRRGLVETPELHQAQRGVAREQHAVRAHRAQAAGDLDAFSTEVDRLTDLAGLIQCLRRVRVGAQQRLRIAGLVGGLQRCPSGRHRLLHSAVPGDPRASRAPPPRPSAG
jgi:hypothetical protein